MLSSVGVGEVRVVQPAAGPVGGDRQRTAAVRFAAAGLSHRGRQRTDARRPRRTRRRSRRFPGLVPDEHDAILDGAPRRRGRRHRLGRVERRHRGPRADASRAARRAGHSRHRHAAEQPDRLRAASGIGSCSAAGQSGVVPLRLRFLRRPRDSRAGRTHQGVAVPLDHAPGWRARSARRSGGSTTRACRSSTGASSRSPSAARRCCRRPRGPTDSSSSPTTARASRAGAEVEVWLYA